MGWLDKAKVALGILDPEDLENMEVTLASRQTTLTLRPRTARRNEAAPNSTSRMPSKRVKPAISVGCGNCSETWTVEADFEQSFVLQQRSKPKTGGTETLVATNPKRQGTVAHSPLGAAADPTLERAKPMREQTEALGARDGHWHGRGGIRRRRIRTTGLVDLLFADPALARTVAARDLDLPGASRHGCRRPIRRFLMAAITSDASARRRSLRFSRARKRGPHERF